MILNIYQNILNMSNIISRNEIRARTTMLLDQCNSISEIRHIDALFNTQLQMLHADEVWHIRYTPKFRL